jgi:sugar phosphate permease
MINSSPLFDARGELSKAESNAMSQTETIVKPAVGATAQARPPAAAALPGENAVIWTLWLTYGAFYFCRTNISSAVAATPGLMAPTSQGGLGLTGEQVGWILASSKIAYGLGQFLNGQLSERLPPRWMLAIGMFGSAALNVLFGFSEAFYFLLFVWATNGFCQSLGWTPCVRVAANWVPIARRGHAIGLIGTGYQITFGLTYLIASYAADLLSWRGALYVPAALLALAGVFMLVFLREAPGEPSASDAAALGKQSPGATEMPFADGLYWTLYNPALWLLGLALGLLNACRYGFFDWGLKHLTETRQMPVSKAALQYFVISIGATAGAYLAGWATDRFFGSRRAPVICLLMAMLGCLSLVYDAAVQHSAIATMLLLVPIGFCIIGPQVLLVGTAPADLAHRGTSAAAAGFVNFMGYMGAATGDVVTGYFSSKAHGGWERAIFIWAAWAFAGSVLTALLWNASSRKLGIVPAIVPKVLAIVTLLGAGVAVTHSHQAAWLQVATYAAAALLVGVLLFRLAAVPALVISLVGPLVIYLQMKKEVPWDQAAAMLAFGLTSVACLMVLVEKKGESCASS